MNYCTACIHLEFNGIEQNKFFSDIENLLKNNIGDNFLLSSNSNYDYDRKNAIQKQLCIQIPQVCSLIVKYHEENDRFFKNGKFCEPRIDLISEFCTIFDHHSKLKFFILHNLFIDLNKQYHGYLKYFESGQEKAKATEKFNSYFQYLMFLHHNDLISRELMLDDFQKNYNNIPEIIKANDSKYVSLL